MAVDARAVSVSTTATRLDTAGAGSDRNTSSSVAIYNNGSATVYIGKSNVTTANGFPLAASSSMSIDLDDNEGVFGIVASGTVECRVLEAGV